MSKILRTKSNVTDNLKKVKLIAFLNLIQVFNAYRSFIIELAG